MKAPIDRDGGETLAMLYEGASVSQLCKIFHMDARDVSRKMRNVIPTGMRRGFPVWSVKDAAQALVAPKVSEAEVLEYISGMNFRNLPAALNKEVWNGLRARLRFEQEQGDLWKTDRVQLAINTVVQIVRMNVLLMPDRLARSGTITPEQRESLQLQADALLEDLKTQIQKAMKGLDPMTPGFMDYAEVADGEDEVDAGQEDDGGSGEDELPSPDEDFSDL